VYVSDLLGEGQYTRFNAPVESDSFGREGMLTYDKEEKH